MKILLTILCSLVVTFAGGCGLVLADTGMSIAGVLVIYSALNLFVVIGMWVNTRVFVPGLYLLGVADVAFAAWIGYFLWQGFAFSDEELIPILLLVVLFFVVKFVLAFCLGWQTSHEKQDAESEA